MAKSSIPVNPAIASRAAAVQSAGVPAGGASPYGGSMKAAAPQPAPTAMPAKPKHKKKKHRAPAPPPPNGPAPSSFRGKATGRDTSDTDQDGM